MNMNSRFFAPARARLVFTIIAAAVFALPAVSRAQTPVRVPPMSIQVTPWGVQAPVPIAPPVQPPPVAVQVPPVVGQAPIARPKLDVEALDRLKSTLDSLQPALADLDLPALKLDALKDFDMARLDAQLDALDWQQGRVVTVRPTPFVWAGDAASSYEAGLNALDNEQWQRAIERFDQVIKANKTRMDGAMYWKAYALDKLGQRNDALTTLQTLEKGYPNSRYLDDAKALEIEVRKSAGQEVKPEDQTNQDLKLMALNSVMQADPERGIPLLEQIIKGNNPLKIKERALFLLSMSDSPRARDVLVNVAKGGVNPDLQIKAIRALGARSPGFAYSRLLSSANWAASGAKPADSSAKPAESRAADNGKLLGEIYASSKDPDVKREIIRSLMMARDVDQLLTIAKTEPSAELRIEAIRGLGGTRFGGDIYERLAGLYSTEKDAEIRQQIFRSMMASGNAQRAAELAKQEADAKVRAGAVRSLGTADSAKTGDALVQIYKSDKDQGVKKAVISALYMQQNAKALVDLARAESDPTLKKEIVSRLSTMKAKEATDYMLELLK